MTSLEKIHLIFIIHGYSRSRRLSVRVRMLEMMGIITEIIRTVMILPSCGSTINMIWMSLDVFLEDTCLGKT